MYSTTRPWNRADSLIRVTPADISAAWIAMRVELVQRLRREEAGRWSHPPADDEPDESDDDTDVFEPETGDPGAADAPTVRKVVRS